MTLVLVVDDDPGIREVLALVLRSAGFDVVEAEGGAEALFRVGQQPKIDVMVLDLLMPLVNGFDVLRILATDSRRPGIVVLSAIAELSDTAYAQGLSADAVLSKPFRIEAVVAAVRSVLAQRAVPEAP